MLRGPGLKKLSRNDLEKCCASKAWIDEMFKRQPFISVPALLKTSEDIWFSLKSPDWLEAFSAHPKIGDVASLKEKFQNTKDWAQSEQGQVKQAPDEVLEELARINQQYQDKFGFIFIVCATGKSAPEMLEILKKRIQNDVDAELKNAATEQNKITKLRLEKIL